MYSHRRRMSNHTRRSGDVRVYVQSYMTGWFHVVEGDTHLGVCAIEPGTRVAKSRATGRGRAPSRSGTPQS